MRGVSAVFGIVLAAAAAQGATFNTTLTVNASSSNATSFSGTASLTTIGTGTFSATLNTSGTSYTAPYTITITSGTTGTITGTLTIPVTVLSGSGTASATVTGGTGNFAGASGSFPSLQGSGGINTSTFTVTLTFSGAGQITTGGSGGGGTPTGPPPPAITAVLDSASNTADVAQGGIFIVKGTNLCPNGVNVFNVPRPTVSPDGVKITFTPTSGGAGTDSILVYTYNPSGTCQLAGILPSTVAPGNYNVTVTNGSASAPFATKVLQRKFTLFTQDSTGSGLASVQNFVSATQYDLNSFTTGKGKGTTISPGKPGQVLIAYGTGMGPLVGGDNTASPAYDFNANGVSVKAIVGGMSIPVLYAGRAGYAGEDQINFQLPSNVPTGCTVAFQIQVNDQLSNPTFIAIAPDANASACVQPGFTTSQLQQYDNGLSSTFGYFALEQFSITQAPVGTIKFSSAGGGFVKYTGYQLLGLSQYQSQITPPTGCTVSRQTYTQSNSSGSGSSGATTAVSAPSAVYLDAGVVTLNGPSGSNLNNQPFTQDANTHTYLLNIGTTGLPGSTGNNFSLVPGQYNIAGAGGPDVGKFGVNFTLGAILNSGSLPATVNRSQALTVTWTGGSSSDYVVISGSSLNATGTSPNLVYDIGAFSCTTNGAAGTFTVPSSILQQLPATGTGIGSSGLLSFYSLTNPTRFDAPLTVGGNIDLGLVFSYVSSSNTASFQ